MKVLYIQYAYPLIVEPMLLTNSILKLDYNPATDVLVTCMPDLRTYALAEVSYCLDLMVESIRTYDIKKMLLDSSQTLIEVEDASYKAVMAQFAWALADTHLKKIARVGTADIMREDKAAKLASELRAEVNLPVEYKSFISQTEAMNWLLAGEQA